MISYSNAATFISSEKVGDAYLSTAENLFQAFLVDLRLKRDEEVEHSRRPFRGYGDGRGHVNCTRKYKGNERRKVLWDMCIVCGKIGCHSSVHQRSLIQLYRRFDKPYFADENASPDEDALPPLVEIIEESDGEEYEDIDKKSESYVSFARKTARMCMSSSQSQ